MPEISTTKQLRSFGLLVGAIFVLIGVWPAIFRSSSPRFWAFALASLLILPAITMPRVLRPVYRVWMEIGHALGWVNTKVVLGLIFYGVVTPTGLLMRLFHKDPMRRKFEATANTYRISKEVRSSSHMKHQF